jgi:hypothetical protein
MITPIEIGQTDFMESLNKVFANAINSSNILNEEVKAHLIREIRHTWFERREDPKVFIEDAVGYAISLWIEQNLQLAELWKSVAINAARHSNNPEEIANNVLITFKKGIEIKP